MVKVVNECLQNFYYPNNLNKTKFKLSNLCNFSIPRFFFYSYMIYYLSFFNGLPLTINYKKKNSLFLVQFKNNLFYSQ